MILNRVNLRKLFAGELLACLNQSIAIITATDPKTVAAIGIREAVVAAFIPILTKLFAKDQGSAITENIIEADVARDHCVSGIRKVADGYSLNYLPDFAVAGDIVYRALDKYGSITNESFNEETTIINSFLKEVNDTKELKDAVTKLNLTDWVKELDTSNMKFNTLYLSRVQESANEPHDNELAKRNEAIVAFKKMMDAIESAAELDDKGSYDSMINQLNDLTKTYDDLIAERKGKHTKKEGNQ
jgi:hypothetical protein